MVDNTAGPLRSGVMWEVEALFEAGFLGPAPPPSTGRGRIKFKWLEGTFFLTQRFVNE